MPTDDITIGMINCMRIGFNDGKFDPQEKRLDAIEETKKNEEFFSYPLNQKIYDRFFYL